MAKNTISLTISIVKQDLRAKYIIQFSSLSIGEFTIDTEYMEADEALKNVKKIIDEFSPFSDISFNQNATAKILQKGKEK